MRFPPGMNLVRSRGTKLGRPSPRAASAMRVSRRVVGRVSGRAEVRSSRRAGAYLAPPVARRVVRASDRGSDPLFRRIAGALSRVAANRLARSMERGLFLARLAGVFDPDLAKDGLLDLAYSGLLAGRADERSMALAEVPLR